MLSFDDRSRNMYNPVPTQESGQATPFTGQLSPLDSPTQPQPAVGQTNISSDQLPFFSSTATRQLTPLPESDIPRVFTGSLDAPGQRAPVIIRGNLKKPTTEALEPRPKRRKFATIAGIIALFLVMSFSLLITTPLSHTIGLNISSPPSKSDMSIASGDRNNAGNAVNIIAQATATAVYNQQSDGYDPSANGVVSVGSGNSPRPWPYGQCTYWANYYYHQLTNNWVVWSGDAYQWVEGATLANWHVSKTPPSGVPSIMVLMPGVQLSSYYYGHVVVVTSVLNSTTVRTSGMNWNVNGGGPGIVSIVDFNYGPGYPGTYFVWR